MHLITFDIDGTLVDSQDFDSHLYVESIREVLDVGIDSDWSTYKHVTDSGILDQIIEKNDLSRFRMDLHKKVRRCFLGKTEDYISNQAGSLPEVPGAKKLLELLLSKKEIALAIATGGWEETARMKLQAVGINADDLPLSSASDSFSRIEIMKLAAQHALNGNKAHTKTYFGDGPWDKMASKQLNYQFIAVGNRVDHNLRVADFRNPTSIFTMLDI